MTSPYHEFQRRGPQILPNWTSEGDGALHDHDGAVLHETEYSGLLRAIIKRNDVVLLKRYLSLHASSLGPADSPVDDPFWTAAAHGSTDALHVMLQHWAAKPSSILSPDARGFRLLHVACAHAQLGIVRFLTDERQPWASQFGNTHLMSIERDAHGYTAILSAATWYRYGNQHEYDQSEQLMHLLLSRGARATDAIFPPSDTEPLQPLSTVAILPKVDQALETVMGLAIAGASAGIIGHLIDGGAGVHAKTIYVDTNGLFEGMRDVAWDVTPLHVGSLFANVNGIEVLRERQGGIFEWREMVSRRDSHGRLPLHWAAGGIWSEAKSGSDEVVRTMTLLLADNDGDMVNSSDAQGYTPLHYAVSSSAYDAVGAAPRDSAIPTRRSRRQHRTGCTGSFVERCEWAGEHATACGGGGAKPLYARTVCRGPYSIARFDDESSHPRMWRIWRN